MHSSDDLIPGITLRSMNFGVSFQKTGQNYYFTPLVLRTCHLCMKIFYQLKERILSTSTS